LLKERAVAKGKSGCQRKGQLLWTGRLLKERVSLP
jgi:hypothetical protein